MQRGENALSALEQAWRRRAEAPPSDDASNFSADNLAGEFRRQLQALPELVGTRLNSAWIRQHYPVFCKSLGIHSHPPAYKDFANELAGLMPRKRCETWSKGKRIDTTTWYAIPDPAASVVAVADPQRKRA